MFNKSQYSTRYTMNTNTERLFYYTACPTIVTRAQCGLRDPPLICTPLQWPVPTVIIHHVATTACTTLLDCCTRIRSIENNNALLGIGYHFFIREDGRAFEGLRLNCACGHAGICNSRSICFAIIGDFTGKPICTVLQHDTH